MYIISDKSKFKGKNAQNAHNAIKRTKHSNY